MGDGGADLSLLSDLWTDVRESDEAAHLEAELARELAEGHVLKGRAITALAARKLRKEVIFAIPDENRWAWVHLTWNAERDARWPSTEVCGTWAELLDVLRDAERG
ncbi:hypothetical protein [Nocardioides sp. 616]|uniref:hypothetical protein n=1 Tax=Nocardioides sp. 616 TaxID=2268090 RepID=UPI0013B3FD1B|nr:hypothetical protein [Nocardioides sp. 616]